MTFSCMVFEIIFMFFGLVSPIIFWTRGFQSKSCFNSTTKEIFYSPHPLLPIEKLFEEGDSNRHVANFFGLNRHIFYSYLILKQKLNMTRYAGKGTHQRTPKDSTSWEELKATPSKKERFSRNNNKGKFNKGQQQGKNNNFRPKGNSNFRQNGNEEMSANFVKLGERPNNNDGQGSSGGGKRTVQGFGQSKQVKVMGQFWVPVEDAKRLKSLSKKMKDEGLSKKEIADALKNERRKAEKSARRARDKICFNCRQFGHILFDCPKSKEKEGDIEGLSSAEMISAGAEICFKCGSTEHSSRHCKKSADKFDFAKCFVCSKTGHIARQCPDNTKGIYPTGGCCNECGEATHLAKDCLTLYPGESGTKHDKSDDAVTSRMLNPFTSSEYEGETFVATKESKGGQKNFKRPIVKEGKETMDKTSAPKKRRVKF